MHSKHNAYIAGVLTLFVLMTLIVGGGSSASAAPGDLTRVSVDSSGAQVNGGSSRPAISDAGRYVAFASGASNLVSGDTNNAEDIFVKDVQTGVTTRVSMRSNGAEANGGSASPAISADGRFVAFYSEASNLLSGDTNGFADIFVHDRQTSQTTRVSINSSGAQANAPPSDDYGVVTISADGRYVAFYSDASNLVSGDTNNETDIFVHDRQTGQTTRASVASNGAEANGGSHHPNLSGNGRFVTFTSGATNLVAGDTNDKRDVFVRDLQTGTTTRVSVDSRGEQADGGGSSPDISGDGRFVTFLSASGNLDPRADEYRSKDLAYVHDRQGGQTTLASVYSEGGLLTVGLIDQPTISRDGRFVAFAYYDKGNNDGIMNIWAHDLLKGESFQVARGNDSSFNSSISENGSLIAFSSGASNLVSGDTNNASDIFVKEISQGADRNPTVATTTPDCGLSTPLCLYPTPSSVVFIVNFSEQVTGVTVDDFSIVMLDGITGATITGLSGYGSQYYVTVNTGAGDGKLRLDVLDNDSILDSALNPLGGAGAGNGDFTKGKSYLIDKNLPIVTGITCTDPNPTVADLVRFTVNFSEVVWPLRDDDFVLVTTGTLSGVAVTAISPREDEYTGAATYTVTVSTGTGDGTLRLDLVDDDSIGDWDGPNPLGGVGAGNGNFSSGEVYTITRSGPLVIGVQRADPSPTSAARVNFTVVFSESVTGVDASDFTLTGISGASVTAVSGSGATYSVTVTTGTGDGTLRLDVVDDDSILNGSGSPVGGEGAGNGNFTSGDAYTIDKTYPIVTGSRRIDQNPTDAESVRFNLTFSESVTGVDAGDFILTTTDSVAGVSILTVNGSANTYTVTAATGSGEGTIRLDVIDNDSIIDSVGLPLGGSGVGNGNFTLGDAYTITKVQTRLFSETLRSNGANDGWVLESAEDSNVGGSRNSISNTFFLGDNAQDRQFRAVLHFPTQYLPDHAVINQVILMIKKQGVIGTDPFTTHQNITIDVRSGFFGSAGFFGINSLDVSDFQAPADRESVGVIANNPISGWYWAMLDSSAFPNINLQGVTQIRLRFAVDDNDDMGDDYLAFFSGNHDQLAERPRLAIEYYVPR